MIMNKTQKEYKAKRENIKNISSEWLLDILSWCKEKRFPKESYKHIEDELKDRKVEITNE